MADGQIHLHAVHTGRKSFGAFGFLSRIGERTVLGNHAFRLPQGTGSPAGLSHGMRTDTGRPSDDRQGSEPGIFPLGVEITNILPPVFEREGTTDDTIP